MRETDGWQELSIKFSGFAQISDPKIDVAKRVTAHFFLPAKHAFAGNVFADLVRWNQEAELIDKGEALEFLAYSEGNSNSATKILQEARGLREALFRIFQALDRRKTPAARDLAALNETLRAFPIRLELRSEGRDFCCERKSAKTNDDRLLAPIAWSAADLLASDRVHHVRQCADAECGWFFVDTTKNHSRRWCAMSDCGSHAKAKRYYQRKKKINR